jgi:(S)-3,5-dihydroxyphenylglycine transaminase
MAYHTLVHEHGEPATARGCGESGACLVVSAFSSRSLEEIAAAATGPLWLQTYCFRDRDAVTDLVGTAARAGLQAIVLTVDTPRMGRRLRDLRNGFRVPPGTRPVNLATSVAAPAGAAAFDDPARHSAVTMDPAADWSYVTWLLANSPLPVLLKGILAGEDAARAVDAGAAGVIVSNHGGRQLDGAPAGLTVLPEVAAAVDGRCPVLLDGGVRTGGDVLAALAWGADAVLVGRPVLHALAVDGSAGVAGLMGLLTEEITEAMMLTGRPAIADVDRSLVLPRAYGAGGESR